MATQYTGTWAPSNGFLPIITDPEIQFAAFYVTEPGTFNGINYSLGDWLIYIDDSTDKWFKSTGGIVSFNLSSSTMSPDPGTYTKVILGQNGNIVEASTLSPSDLPKHSHKLSDVDQESMPASIYAALKRIFTNSEENAVKFKFDDRLKTLSADIDIDEVSIKKNNYGQLYNDGTSANEEGEEIESPGSGGSGGTSTPVKISIENVTSLASRLASIESQIALNKILASSSSAISLVKNNGGTYADVKIDGLSVIKNADGELCVNPDLLSVYTINGLNVTTDPNGNPTGTVGGTCGNFTLAADEIEGLDEYFENKIIEYTKIFTVSANNLPIDEDTIIINSEGKLSAVFSKVTAHSHKFDDITDFPREFLQWASLQVLHNDTDNPIDFTQGKFNISGYTIGNVLEIYNQEFENLQEEIDKLKLVSGKVEPGTPPNIDAVTISLTSSKLDVFDTESSSVVSAFYGLVTTSVSSKFYPHNTGSLEVLLDNVVVAAIELNDNVQLGNSNNGLTIEKLEDYYKEIPGFMGTYQGIAISYKVNNLLEGTHTLQYRHVIGSNTYESNKVSFNYVVDSRPQIESINIKMPTMSKYVSGVPSAEYNSPAKSIIYLTKVMSNKYLPIDLGYFSFIDPNSGNTAKGKIEIESISSQNKEIISKVIDVKFPEKFSGNLTINASAKDIFGNIVNSIEESSTYIRFDSSTVEPYRYIYIDDDSNNYPPDDITSPVIEKFDPNVSLVGSDSRYRKELQIINDVALFKYANYLSYGGPDYSVLDSTICEGASVRWITLMIPCSKKIFNGYIDIIDGGGYPFIRNLDGSLKDIFIWVSPTDTSTMIVNNWVNLNKPFSGYSTFKYTDKNYYGLDLARSGPNRRWFTFGRKPLAMNYNALVIKIALVEGKSLNIKKIISSLEESINGQL